MSFRADTLVGEMQLKAGRYKLQHRVDGADHFVHFTELTKGHGASGTGGGAAKAHPGEVKCRLEPFDKKASRTEVHTRKEVGSERVTKVLISGENVVHVF